MVSRQCSETLFASIKPLISQFGYGARYDDEFSEETRTLLQDLGAIALRVPAAGNTVVITALVCSQARKLIGS